MKGDKGLPKSEFSKAKIIYGEIMRRNYPTVVRNLETSEPFRLPCSREQAFRYDTSDETTGTRMFL